MSTSEPEATSNTPDATSPHPDVDAALADLAEGEKTWADLSLAGRRKLLDKVHDLTVQHAADWVDTAVAIKGLDPKSPLVGEEWMSGPYPLATGTAALSASLAKLEAGSSPLDGATFGTAPGGRTTVKALPLNIFDKLLLSGFSADVWLQPGIDRATAQRDAGLAQRDPSRTQGIGVVLGAGNITSIAPLDTLYELIAHNRVVALKLNPITDRLLVAAQAVVVSSEWKQRDEFVAALKEALDTAPDRAAYYPGSDSRVAGAKASFPTAARLGENGGRVLVTDLEPGAYAPLLQTEYFAPVLGVIDLPHGGAEFAAHAADLVNEDFIGTLGVNIVAAPQTIRELGAEFDSLLESLRYGTIAVNAWTGVGYLTATATWGAFPGHTLDDVQSGIGVVHNALLIDRPERTVVRGPFRPSPRSILNREMSISPKPPWFVTNRTAATTGRLLTGFAGAPSWTRLPAIFASALRG
ncbi:MAG: aldehyde dehydrogenase [Rhodococcus sp. (in: high G+C Gram-positive bacteria)]|nr:MAG: aldehyde dehydrogenase [Rhodococcus sp. (in: high G+C Gram-positive bacteria)]